MPASVASLIKAATAPSTPAPPMLMLITSAPLSIAHLRPGIIASVRQFDNTQTLTFKISTPGAIPPIPAAALVSAATMPAVAVPCSCCPFAALTPSKLATTFPVIPVARGSMPLSKIATLMPSPVKPMACAWSARIMSYAQPFLARGGTGGGCAAEAVEGISVRIDAAIIAVRATETHLRNDIIKSPSPSAFTQD